MDQKTSDIRLAQWEQIVLEGNKALVSKQEWCKQQGINIKSFYYWQRKLRLKAAADTMPANSDLPAALSPSTTTTVQTSFVEIPFPAESPILSQPDSDRISCPKAEPELIIQIQNCQILVNSSAQEQTLRKVLRVIHDA